MSEQLTEEVHWKDNPKLYFRLRAKEYYKKHKVKIIRKTSKYALEHPEQHKVSADKWYNENKVAIAIRRCVSYAKLKAKIFSLLGDKCVRCGETDERVIQIDHVNGGGNKERRHLSGRQYYTRIFNELTNGSKDYQLLCVKCNWIKMHENNECGGVGKE